MKKLYTGACHCGAVRFEADIDLDVGTFKCNCPICLKSRMWGVMVQPEDFRLVAGESALVDYRPDGAHHFFCKHCGVRPFGRVDDDRGVKFYAVRVACLEDVDVDNLVNAPITYYDGQNDNYQNAPAETRHL